MATAAFGNVFAGMWALIRRYPVQLLRGSNTRHARGHPARRRRRHRRLDVLRHLASSFSKEPEKFGTGHVEGIVEAGTANNAALAGAWIPALVFGIPGDSITAIVIGVLYMKGMNPGPMIFVNNPQNIYAVFIVFILANLLMLPFGWLAIKAAKRILRVPRKRADAADPALLHRRRLRHQQLACSAWRDAGRRRASASSWSADGFPVAPTILGVVLGTMLEEHFFSCLIKADGHFLVVLRAADRRHAGRAVPADLAVAGGADAAASGGGIARVHCGREQRRVARCLDIPMQAVRARRLRAMTALDLSPTLHRPAP